MRQPLHVRQRALAIDLAQAAGGGIGKHGRPDLVGLADGIGVAMLRHFLGIEPGVGPAHQYRDAALSVIRCDFVGAARKTCPDRDGRHVAGSIKIDRRQALVEDAHLPFPWRQRRQIGQGETHQAPLAGLQQASVHGVGRRLYDVKMHRNPRLWGF